MFNHLNEKYKKELIKFVVIIMLIYVIGMVITSFGYYDYAIINVILMFSYTIYFLYKIRLKF